jgi:hypothetical protein
MSSVGTTVARSAKGYKVREACFQDYEQIMALQGRYGLTVRGYEDWSRLWLGNPLYGRLKSRWPIGWVLEDPTGRIVGSIGNMPLPYEWDGEKITASSGISWVAEPAYRGPSLLLLDMLINQPGVDVYLNSTVTKAAQKAIEVSECRRVPVGVWDERGFWITNHRGFSASWLVKNGIGAANLLSYPVAVASWMNDRLRRREPLQRSTSVEACSEFDNRFDEFWSELRRRRRNQLVGVRSSEVLNWHFGDSMRKKQLWIGVIPVHGKIAAFAVFDRRDNPQYRLKRMRLADYQSLDGTDELLGPLLSWALERCRRTGIHMFENVGRWLEKGELVARSAPYRSTLNAWSYYYRATNGQLAEPLRSPGAWWPTLFDGNASL